MPTFTYNIQTLAILAETCGSYDRIEKSTGIDVSAGFGPERWAVLTDTEARDNAIWHVVDIWPCFANAILRSNWKYRGYPPIALVDLTQPPEEAWHASRLRFIGAGVAQEIPDPDHW